MKGAIVLWSGAIVDIPDGWLICDGNNGTPDLRNRFVVGAGSDYAVDETGGNLTHTHTFTSNGHQHQFSAGVNLAGGPNWGPYTTTDVDTGTTDASSSLPRYYALAFIMKT